MRRASKVDANHRLIVAAFRALGCSVQSLAAVGKGVPDLLVGLAGLNHLVEVKVANGKETPLQVKWAALWRTPTHLVRNVEDVQRLVGVWKSTAVFHVSPPPALDLEHGFTYAHGSAATWVPTPHAHSPVASDVEVDASDYERPNAAQETA